MSIFDGMTGLLADVLGGAVSYTPAAGVPRDIPSIFREDPIEITDQDGHPVLIVAPTWQVDRSLVPELARSDRVNPGNGKIYRILNLHPSGSPAADAAVICELEKLVAP